jgi:hypothetical protein
MNSGDLANAPSRTRYKEIYVRLDENYGNPLKAEKSLIFWLYISHLTNEELGGLSPSTLGQYCRATTGQAGVLLLVWEDQWEMRFQFDMKPCGFCA